MRASIDYSTYNISSQTLSKKYPVRETRCSRCKTVFMHNIYPDLEKALRNRVICPECGNDNKIGRSK